MVEQLRSRRLSGIGEYYFSQKLREIDELNRRGNRVLNLGIGSPDLSPPDAVSLSLIRGINDPQFHRYQSYKGIPELREAFGEFYEKFYEVNLNPEKEILPLIGSKEGIMHVCMAFLNDGDEALVPNPGYPAYSASVKLAGGVPKIYRLTEENDFLPDLDALESKDLSRVKLMWVNYPHMPTGAEASTELFDQLITFCKKHQIILVNDNPYSFILTERPKSLLEKRDEESLVLELNSLSKSHNMAGWRVGVLCGHEKLIEQVLTFKSNMDSGMFKPVMLAAVEALRQGNSWFESLNKTYSERKWWACEILKILNCTFSNRQAGLFVWAKVPVGVEDGKTFSNRLLSEYKLFLPPGMIFGDEGDQYIRISLCSSTELLKEALNRITNES